MARRLDGAEYVSEEGEILRVDTFAINAGFVLWNTGERTRIIKATPNMLVIEKPTGGELMARFLNQEDQSS